MTKSFEQVRNTIAANGDAIFHCFMRLEKHTVKKNKRPIKINHRTGNRFIGKSNELVCAEQQMINIFRRQILRSKDFKIIDRPIWCVFLFYFPEDDFVVKNGPRKGRMSGRLPDLSNLYELPQDCLQKAGVIANDNLICSHDLSRRLPGLTCALEVFIFEYPMETRPHLQSVDIQDQVY